MNGCGCPHPEAVHLPDTLPPIRGVVCDRTRRPGRRCMPVAEGPQRVVFCMLCLPPRAANPVGDPCNRRTVWWDKAAAAATARGW